MLKDGLFEMKPLGLECRRRVENAATSQKWSLEFANMRNESASCELAEVASERSVGRAGFTIIEALIATAVLSITMATFILLSLSSLRQLELASDYFRANALARNRVERIKIMNFDTILGLNEAEHRVDGHGNPDPEGSYRRETIVTPVTENCANVKVTVSFPDRPGHLQANPVVIETLYTRGL